MDNKPKNRPPNILIIFPDQLRRYAAGYWSAPDFQEHVIGEPDPVITPNIDQLAREGLVFTHAISNYPVCSPHRGMMLTGMHPEKNGLIANCHRDKPYALRKDITTMIDVFLEQGYNTSYFGKCHWVRTLPHFDEKGNYIGTDKPPGGHFINGFDTYVPPGEDRHGIEYFYQSINDGHFSPMIYSNDPNAVGGLSDGEPYRPAQFSTKMESSTIIDYINNEKRQRDSDKPFLAIWSINPPHGSWADQHVETTYRDKHYNEEKFPKITDLLVRKNLISDAENEVTHVRNYFSAVSSVDHYIGKVKDHLKEKGLLENTLILFTSDHGEYLGSHRAYGKSGPYLEAYGVPFILSWPEKIKPGLEHRMIGVTDIMPTLLGLTGHNQTIPTTVQGSDYSPFILGDTEQEALDSEDCQLLLFPMSNSRGILTQDHLLMIHRDLTKDKVELSDYLFDLQKDPYQTHKIPLTDRPDESELLLKKLGELLYKFDDSWAKEKKYSEIFDWSKIN